MGMILQYDESFRIITININGRLKVHIRKTIKTHNSGRFGVVFGAIFG